MSLQSGLIVAMGFHLLLIVISIIASTRISQQSIGNADPKKEGVPVIVH